MGAWRNLGSYSCFFKMKRSGGIRQLFVDDELYSDPRKRRFKVTKAYFKNQTDVEIKKNVFRLEGGVV